MMNIPPAEAGRLDIYTYEGMLWNWNEAHRHDSDIELPDPEIVLPMLDQINADPRLIH